MRHDEHNIWLSISTFPASIFPKLSLVVLLPQLGDEFVQTLGNIFRRLAAFAAVAPDIPVCA